jgi:trehalose/maltose hydrolase-like predicted phosphorylase
MVVILASAGGVPAWAGGAGEAAVAIQPAARGWVLDTNSSRDAATAPAYVGNGYVGTRISAAGAGFVDAPVATETHIAGVYADVTDLNHGTLQPQGAVNVPGWTALDFSDGTATYGLSTGTLLSYHQALDLRAGTVTTAVTWASPGGRVTDLRYVVVLDRARARIGAVDLRVRPHWSGTAQVTDVLGGGFDYHPPWISPGLDPDAQSVSPPRRTAQLRVRAKGTGIVVAYTDRLRPPAGAVVEGVAEPHVTRLTASFPVAGGRWYEVSKTVGMATSLDSARPQEESAQTVTAAGDFPALLREDANAWAELWRADIVVPGNDSLQRSIHAAEFYLMSSVRGQPGPPASWSLSPVGLSSNGYHNHVFWDAETWMYPALLAQHPDLAYSVVDYRYRSRDGARRNAERTGYQGLRFAWESARDGVEVTPAWAETGALEQHVTADVALAQWQYFLATGDRRWLADKGWPVIRGAADFWASRATRHPDGSWSILHVEGPDEHHYPVDDSVYTNVGAKTTLELAARAAGELGQPVPPLWREVAGGLVVLPARQWDAWCCMRPEFRGYLGDQVKQADAVMLTYPWEYPQPRVADVSDLDFYATHYDPNGPAMTDSVNSIVSAQVDQPGCADWTYTLRSQQPFEVPPYAQFTEARSGHGVFTFLTGEGGFLQEFLYGYSGLRWRGETLRVAPKLPPQLAGGLQLRSVQWRGRVIDVTITRDRTQVALRSGPPMTLQTPSGTKQVRVGAPAWLPTAHPDETTNGDAALCRAVTATSADASYPAVAAVDGSDVTSWQPTTLPAALTVRFSDRPRVAAAALTWDGSGSVKYTADLLADDHWQSVGAGIAPARSTTTLHFEPSRTTAVRVNLVSDDASVGLANLTVSRG